MLKQLSRPVRLSFRAPDSHTADLNDVDDRHADGNDADDRDLDDLDLNLNLALRLHQESLQEDLDALDLSRKSSHARAAGAGASTDITATGKENEGTGAGSQHQNFKPSSRVQTTMSTTPVAKPTLGQVPFISPERTPTVNPEVMVRAGSMSCA